VGWIRGVRETLLGQTQLFGMWMLVLAFGNIDCFSNYSWSFAQLVFLMIWIILLCCYLTSPILVPCYFKVDGVHDPIERKHMIAAIYVMAPFFWLLFFMRLIECGVHYSLRNHHESPQKTLSSSDRGNFSTGDNGDQGKKT
jgi:Na+/proline symporter